MENIANKLDTPTPFDELKGKIEDCNNRLRVVHNGIKQSVNSLAGSEPEADAQDADSVSHSNILGELEALMGIMEIEIGHLEHQTNRLGKLF